MSNIPSYIISSLEQFGQPSFIGATPGFRLMVAVRKAFDELNKTLPAQPRYSTLEMSEPDATRPFVKLTPLQLDAAASAIKVEVSKDLTDQDLQTLAKGIVEAFLASRKSFAEGGFYDPTAAALQMMAKFSISF